MHEEGSSHHIGEELANAKREIERLTTQLEAAVKAQQLFTQRMKQLFEGLPTACFSLDLEGTVFEWNHESERLFQAEVKDVFGRPIWECVEAVEGEGVFRSLLERAKSGEAANREELAFRSGRRKLWLQISVIPLLGPNGDVTGIIAAGADVTAGIELRTQLEEKSRQLQQANCRLQELATSDGLTGLLNHKAFRDLMSQHEGAVAILMADIDHFKSINDGAGHLAGDEALRQVGITLSESLPDGAIAARYGGEEFVALLPDHDEAQGAAVAEIVRSRVESNVVKPRQVTISLGIASKGANSDLADEELIDRADKALYMAKHRGRNRVVAWSDTRAEGRAA